MFGYIDPGTGSLIIQGIIAAFVGTGFYFRRFLINPFVSVWRFITGQKNEENIAAEQPQESPAV